jgi:hypothetical protein
LVLLLVGRSSVGAVWPKAGDAIAVNAIHRRASHGRAVMIVFLSKLANRIRILSGSLQKSGLSAVGTGSAS